MQPQKKDRIRGNQGPKNFWGESNTRTAGMDPGLLTIAKSSGSEQLLEIIGIRASWKGFGS